MTNETLFRLENVDFAYDGREALHRLNLEIYRGETLALVGPNGSGKTTLLKILNDLLRPSSGTVLFRGRPSAGDKELRTHSVYVHQSPFLLAGTVYRNVSFGLTVRRETREETRLRVAEALALLGLSGFERRDAKRLSGGETQRVAIARALALRPDILLLDEPTAQTDKASGEKIHSVVSSLSRERGVTVILSTHDTILAKTLANRSIFLDEGLVSHIEGTRRHERDAASGIRPLENPV